MGTYFLVAEYFCVKYGSSLFERKQKSIINYLKERNCLRDKLSRFFAKFAKLNPHEKSTGSQFANLHPREKQNIFFLSFFRISKNYIFTLGSVSVNDDHVKNILQDIKQYK